MTESIISLQQLVGDFCEERDWNQFHNIKDLSIALSIEASELLERFRWKETGQLQALLDDAEKREAIEDEVSDVLFFILRIAQTSNIDLAEALKRKIMKNVLKYPVDKARGNSKKYNEF